MGVGVAGVANYCNTSSGTASNVVAYGGVGGPYEYVSYSGSVVLSAVGIYTWQVPAGVTSISVVAVGGGGSAGDAFGCSCTTGASGGGGALAYKNNIAVTLGQSILVTVGYPGRLSVTGTMIGGDSIFGGILTAGGGNTTLGGIGGGVFSGVGVLGGNGGNGVYNFTPNGAGGAGGYSGNGGNGYTNPVSPATSGAGGAGAGGGSATLYGGGGGVGLFGQGTDGTNSAGVGGGGSGGTNGGIGTIATIYGGSGGVYGGGAARISTIVSAGQGAIRIVWPGTTRQFPSTNVGTV